MNVEVVYHLVFMSVQSARGLMHWQVDRNAADTQKRLKLHGLIAQELHSVGVYRNRCACRADACCMTITCELFHVDAKSRVLHATSMVVDPLLMQDLAHFACLMMSSMVHVLC